MDTRIGLAVESISTPGGVIDLGAMADHRIRLHAGPAVRGDCRGRPFVYAEGDLDLVAAGQGDRWQEHGPARSVVVRLSPALLHKTADAMGLPAGRAGLQPRHQFRDPRLEHIVWALEAERGAGFTNGRLYAESLATALAVQLLGRWARPQRASARLSAACAQRVFDYIDAHLDQDLSLPVLAGVVHSSVSHFKTLFKRTVGVAVHEYVVRCRVQRAVDLLRAGRLPASQVALEAGFAHQSHMARCMRRVLGVTPGSIASAWPQHGYKPV